MLVLVAGLLVAGPLGAQVPEEGRLPRGVISGSIVDAESGEGLAGATVVVEPEAGGAMPARQDGGSFLQGAQGMISDGEGRYRFADLAPGRYRLRVSRTGYRTAAVTVELRGAADSRVSVGLSVEPIPLESISVVASPAPPYGRDRTTAEEIGGSREAAARRRQREQLASDARELTHADVVESVTLGETDLFRALQRLPGVSTRSDYTAELWVRGSHWDQTRTYLDGLPLLNPLHGLGLFSGVNPDAVGGALLLPGVRSASLGEGAAAVVDLTSRRGGGEGEVRGSADVSLASARLALDQRLLDGRAAWMLSARRTYLDWLASGIGRLIDDPEASIPYAFSDLTGRVDFQIDGARAVEVSGFHQSDRVTGDVPDVLHRTRARWGNAGGRVTYAHPALGLQARHTLGFSRYAAVVREAEPDPALEDRYSAPGEPRADNEFDFLVVAGQASPAGEAWRAGYALTRQDARYAGPFHHAMGGWRSDPALPLEREGGADAGRGLGRAALGRLAAADDGGGHPAGSRGGRSGKRRAAAGATGLGPLRPLAGRVGRGRHRAELPVLAGTGAGGAIRRPRPPGEPALAPGGPRGAGAARGRAHARRGGVARPRLARLRELLRAALHRRRPPRPDARPAGRPVALRDRREPRARARALGTPARGPLDLVGGVHLRHLRASSRGTALPRAERPAAPPGRDRDGEAGHAAPGGGGVHGRERCALYPRLRARLELQLEPRVRRARAADAGAGRAPDAGPRQPRPAARLRLADARRRGRGLPAASQRAGPRQRRDLLLHHRLVPGRPGRLHQPLPPGIRDARPLRARAARCSRSSASAPASEAMDAGALFEANHAGLSRYLFRLTGDADLAADAAQEAFVRYVERAPRADNPRAWLYTVATNLVREWSRTRTRRWLLLVGGGARAPHGDAPPDPDAALVLGERRERVRGALATLSEKERTALLMREEGFSQREIAEAVGTTTKSVGTLIARALDKLADRLDLDEEDL
jgi:RNA polymerase sigma factor (sigma-70 family)